jgi:hypothetical protein
LQSSATGLKFFCKAQQSIRSFFAILSNGPGLFFAGAHGFGEAPTENAMNIRGSGVWGGGGGAALFLKFAATDLRFFYNPQQPIRCFFSILSYGPEVFLQSSAIDPLFFFNPQLWT